MAFHEITDILQIDPRVLTIIVQLQKPATGIQTSNPTWKIILGNVSKLILVENLWYQICGHDAFYNYAKNRDPIENPI